MVRPRPPYDYPRSHYERPEPFVPLEWPSAETNRNGAAGFLPHTYIMESSSRGNIDWKETPMEHVFKVDVPGMKKEDVKVEVVESWILHISGERRDRQQELEPEEGSTWHCIERWGKFTRRFGLPANVELDQVKAATENGVLTVTVPKKPVDGCDAKPVEISG